MAGCFIAWETKRKKNAGRRQPWDSGALRGGHHFRVLLYMGCLHNRGSRAVHLHLHHIMSGPLWIAVCGAEDVYARRAQNV